MGSKKSIYLSDAAEKILDLDDKTGDSLSGRINATILRFGRMMSESRPALSDAEWLATCDVLNQKLDRVSERFIWAEVADSQGLGKKWEINQPALIKKLREMTITEIICVAEVARRFWVNHTLTTDQALNIALGRDKK